MTAAPWRERPGLWLRPLLYLGRNGLSLTGAVLTTSSALTLLTFWAVELLKGGPVHPYTGIVFFLILPGLFVLGLLLIPVGVVWNRRRLLAQGLLPGTYPRFDWAEPALRRGTTLVMSLTVLNVAIFSTASYRGVQYSDSNQFCGLTCHKVMQPEYTAFTDSPHSRAGCVACHIGSGAPWFVRAKLSGVRQVFAVAFDTYSRPIPSPVKNLRPARETCEECHWPQKFVGDKFVVRTKYSEDEANTPLTTVLMLKIGGRTFQGSAGIHGQHLSGLINYVATDERRQVIPRVTATDAAGHSVEYVSSEVKATPEQLARGERRTMDCMDCHNRPTHAFQLPDRALDQALADGRISPELPSVKKKALELLRVDYPDRDTAGRRITDGLTAFYRTDHPDIYARHRALVETAARQVAAIYMRNVFPDMKVAWGTYPNNIGHADFLGCFRCHDENHKSADGRAITQDCNACHTVLAMEEKNPKVLEDLGLK